MVEQYYGEIKLLGFNYAPVNWKICDGQSLIISDNEALYALLGTSFGGDGRTTFAVPDLRGRVVRGCNYDPELNVGQIGGLENIVITASEMPQHTHSINITSKYNQGTEAIINGNLNLRVGTNGGSVSSTANENSLLDSTINSGYREGATDSLFLGNSIDVQLDSIEFVAIASNTGGSKPINIINPYLGLYYAIAIKGYFPPRN